MGWRGVHQPVLAGPGAQEAHFASRRSFLVSLGLVAGAGILLAPERFRSLVRASSAPTGGRNAGLAEHPTLSGIGREFMPPRRRDDAFQPVTSKRRTSQAVEIVGKSPAKPMRPGGGFRGDRSWKDGRAEAAQPGADHRYETSSS